MEPICLRSVSGTVGAGISGGRNRRSRLVQRDGLILKDSDACATRAISITVGMAGDHMSFNIEIFRYPKSHINVSEVTPRDFSDLVCRDAEVSELERNPSLRRAKQKGPRSGCQGAFDRMVFRRAGSAHHRKQHRAGWFQKPGKAFHDPPVKRARRAQHANTDDEIETALSELDIINITSDKSYGGIKSAYRSFSLVEHSGGVINTDNQNGVFVGVEVPAGPTAQLKDGNRTGKSGGEFLDSPPLDTRRKPRHRRGISRFGARGVFGRKGFSKSILNGCRQILHAPRTIAYSPSVSRTSNIVQKQLGRNAEQSPHPRRDG